MQPCLCGDVHLDNIWITGYGLASQLLGKVVQTVYANWNNAQHKNLNLTKPNQPWFRNAFYAIRPENELGLFYNNSVRDPHGLLCTSRDVLAILITCHSSLYQWSISMTAGIQVPLLTLPLIHLNDSRNQSRCPSSLYQWSISMTAGINPGDSPTLGIVSIFCTMSIL